MDTFLNGLIHTDGSMGIIAELFGVVFTVGLLNLVVTVVLRRLARTLEATRNPWDDALIDAIRAPLHVLLWLLGISFAARLFEQRLEEPAPFFSLIDPVRIVGIIVIVSWFLLRLITRVEQNIINQREAAEQPIDVATADAVAKLLKLTVVITAILAGMQSLGFNLSGILAFGGIGGVTVGLAARDLLANFFGGLTIYMDRPFTIGDWVRSPDRDIEGTVEKIGWRRTLIRTFDQRPLYVPNAVFNNISVENPSRMYNRRIYETVGIRYQDATVMDTIVSEVRSMLLEHPEIDTGRLLMVNFTSFGPSSLDFFIYTFTKTIVWAEYHRVKQDVLLKTLQIIEKHGAEVAFPTSTVHVPESIRMMKDSPQE